MKSFSIKLIALILDLSHHNIITKNIILHNSEV